MSQLKKFLVKQISTPCLSQYTYLILSNKEAAIIDPLREAEPYLKLLKEYEANLKYVFLSHIHADFVSGHVPLARLTNAKIVMGPGANVSFDCHVGKHKEDFSLGDINIRLLHTPGHTLESSCFLLQEDGKDQMLFTGDTLFLGDVGRPDLGVSAGISPEFLSNKLFDSLSELRQLSDDVIVYPGHGAGSPCGKNIQKGDFCTIGNQKKSNCLFKNNNKEEFVKQMVQMTSSFPKYFERDVAMNKSDGVQSTEEILKKSFRPIAVKDVQSLMDKEKVLVIDSRSTADFKAKHIPDSVSVPLSSSYALFAGMLYRNEKIVIVANKGEEQESISRLARVGLDNIVGYLDGGINGWNDEFETLASVTPQQFESIYTKESIDILDVRYPTEFKDGHVKNALHFNLAELAESYTKLDKSKTYFVYCRSGVRSTIAQSFLSKEGIKTINVDLGFNGISSTKIPIDK